LREVTILRVGGEFQTKKGERNEGGLKENERFLQHAVGEKGKKAMGVGKAGRK